MHPLIPACNKAPFKREISRSSGELGGRPWVYRSSATILSSTLRRHIRVRRCSSIATREAL